MLSPGVLDFMENPSLKNPSEFFVHDPVTFEPVTSFLTRYGYVELTNSASSLGNAGDYLSSIAVANLSFS